ncbi:hypothetical protein BKA82DRAFT_4415306 [Pisolithus tinctorius]|nr:hypothetical protein BKA82DRAFT_4415306 [Pisolithus tinctorius]
MPFTDDTVRDTISALKRRINALEEDNRELQSTQKLATSKLEDRLYRNYQELLRWIPTLKSDIAADSEDHEVKSIMKYLNKGADGARGDDAAGLKMTVVSWLMHGQPTPEPALEPRYKAGRGFYHDTTARLICPVDYDWSNVQANIRSFHPDYLVTADCWPYFLYKNEEYDPENPVRGLFKNAMLVQAFKHIFTSPSSADSETVLDDTDLEDRMSTDPLPKHRKGLNDKRSRAHVAALLGMKSICPRAIAYTAVQLRFALSSCNSWRIVDEDFDYEKFYNNMITFFKDVHTPQEQVEISNLLLWWNRSVFGRANASIYRPQATGKMSVASTLRKRREKAAASSGRSTT